MKCNIFESSYDFTVDEWYFVTLQQTKSSWSSLYLQQSCPDYYVTNECALTYKCHLIFFFK